MVRLRAQSWGADPSPMQSKSAQFGAEPAVMERWLVSILEAWKEITREYSKIAPHPDLSWWATRGQLVDAPGYMVNYAIGSIIVADLPACSDGGHGAGCGHRTRRNEIGTR
jgi:hypothetical protein